MNVHRQDDLRSCGATTIVIGQTNVFANGKLISVDFDPNTHGQGNLIARSKNVFINGKMIVNVGDTAIPDSLCPIEGGNHCQPSAITGSENVFVGD